MASGVNKIAAERNQKALLELVNQPGNNTCADCHSHNPRWASWNLGIFICVHCAAVHRKIGTHITKVKSLTLDTWTKEQVETMKAIGNVVSNNKHNADETRFPPPANMIESERDSELEKYIRAKYEFKRFMTRQSRVAEVLGPSRSAAEFKKDQQRSTTMPVAPPSAKSAASNALPYRPPSAAPAPTIAPATAISSPAGPAPMPRSVSQPIAGPSTQHPQQQPSTSGSNPLWNDLASLQAPARSSTLPLQFSATSTQPMNIPGMASAPQPMGISASPNPFASSLMASNTAIGLGNAPGMMGTSPGMMGSSPGMMGSTPGMMGMNNMTTGMPGSTPLGMSNGLGAGFQPSIGGTNPFQQMQSSQQTGYPGSFGGVQNPFGQQNMLGQQQQTPFQPQPHASNPFGQMAQSQPQHSMFSPQPQQQPSPFMPASQPQGFMNSQHQFAGSPSPSLAFGQQPTQQQFGTPSPSMSFGQPSGYNPGGVPPNVGMGGWQGMQQQPGGFPGQTWGSM